ncbi:MAG: DUF2817 domain-containing protein [Solirubrobacterales bacterium]|nr:DUF2817 domain-containing protein [Solirubrobacterales bacterium]
MRAGPLIGLILAGLVVAALGIAGGGDAPSANRAPFERAPGPLADRPTTAPAAGRDADPSAGRDADPAAERDADPVAGRSRGSLAELERTIVAKRGSARRATVTIGRSAEGRAIRAVAINGLSGGPPALVFGCIHGTECAGMRIARRIHAGRPPKGHGIVVVPDLNPDGLALGSRLNARGVDLNRNFASHWRPIGVAGDPEHSGPRPFSEPETRIARRLIRALRPEVTIWFHQQAEPLVRAWGASVPAARRYARLAGARFVRLPWLHGTAPNWQNHRFVGTSSFVVELASGPVAPGTVRDHARAATTLAGGLDAGGRSALRADHLPGQTAATGTPGGGE